MFIVKNSESKASLPCTPATNKSSSKRSLPLFAWYSLAGGISVVGLVKFTSQGDNSGDARELADYLNQWLMVKQVCRHDIVVT